MDNTHPFTAKAFRASSTANFQLRPAENLVNHHKYSPDLPANTGAMLQTFTFPFTPPASVSDSSSTGPSAGSSPCMNMPLPPSELRERPSVFGFAEPVSLNSMQQQNGYSRQPSYSFSSFFQDRRQENLEMNPGISTPPYENPAGPEDPFLSATALSYNNESCYDDEFLFDYSISHDQSISSGEPLIYSNTGDILHHQMEGIQEKLHGIPNQLPIQHHLLTPVGYQMAYVSEEIRSSVTLPLTHLPALPVPITSISHNIEDRLELGECMIHGHLPHHNGNMVYGHHPAQEAVKNDITFKCNQCPQSFNGKYANQNFGRHKRRHTEIHRVARENFSCEYCNKKYTRSGSLRYHMRKKHSGTISEHKNHIREDLGPVGDVNESCINRLCRLSPEIESSRSLSISNYTVGPSTVVDGSRNEPTTKQLPRVSVDGEGDTEFLREAGTLLSVQSKLSCKEGNSRSAISKVNYSNIPVLAVTEDSQTMEPSPKPLSDSTRNNTLSSSTDDETDWGEDESLNDVPFPNFSAFSNAGLDSQSDIKERIMEPVLSPMKQELIDRIMKEFWIIFSQDGGVIQMDSPITVVAGSGGNDNGNKDTPRDGGENQSQTAGSDPLTRGTNARQASNHNSFGQRKRSTEDDEDGNNGEDRSPKRSRTFLSPPQNQDDNTKFACPYRKRDPRKYCIQHWRSCALTPLETVARVKGHLYRHHRIFPCQRCKELFKDQDGVNAHLKEPKGCELRDIEHADGVTAEIVEKLRSKKKAQRDQTEADRWKDIYKLLFPNELIPSPYFEAVQEDLVLSPDSRELADYEEYCRRELPRDFRAALEEIVHNESQPIEENIRNQLMNIIRDCQDRLFSRYRSTAGTASGTPSRNLTSSHSTTVTTQEARDDISETTNTTPGLSFRRVSLPFFQPPSPQIHLRSRLEVSDLQNDAPKPSESTAPSDSGYSSNDSAAHSRLPSSFHRSNDNVPTTNSDSQAASDSVTNDDPGLPVQDGDNFPSNFRDGDATFDNSWLNYNHDLAEGGDWDAFMGMD